MTPLIEDARRRQRRRRIAIGVLIVAVAVAAGLLALFHRAPSSGQRQTQTESGPPVVQAVPGGAIVRLDPVTGRVVALSTVTALQHVVQLRLRAVPGR